MFILFKLTSLPTHQGVPGEETGGRVVAAVVAVGGGVHDSVDTHTCKRTMRMLITVNFTDVAALHRGRDERTVATAGGSSWRWFH